MTKDDKKYKKNSKALYNDISIFINTIDYIKETLGSVNDLVINLIDDPYKKEIFFDQEEEKSLGTLNELIKIIRNNVEQPVETLISNFMNRTNFESLTDGAVSPSKYVGDIKDILRNAVNQIRGKISDVFLTKILNHICQSINQAFINCIFKMKKISSNGVQQLYIGSFFLLN